MALKDQKAGKISNKGHTFLYIKQANNSHLCYICMPVKHFQENLDNY